eukprot:CAMPEP_0172160050 /NCGR_PEP_ID=MMETSP1050-20130122/5337_1 /TAXON_ID=233186 /ORGANISM="Cryptomonas curvata, Strain CCAP979/52" /LENGTH=122 /DNA_ID=CAMNT_0012829759 /DNA_START=178 /DNA_END=546 /DNA_ORIENTATION=+
MGRAGALWGGFHMLASIPPTCTANVVNTELPNIPFGHAEQDLEAVKCFDDAAGRAEFDTVADQDVVQCKDTRYTLSNSRGILKMARLVAQELDLVQPIPLKFPSRIRVCSDKDIRVPTAYQR